jgi:hypothetical protein
MNHVYCHTEKHTLSFAKSQKQDPNSQPYTLLFPSLPFLLGIRIFNYPPDLKIFPVQKGFLKKLHSTRKV